MIAQPKQIYIIGAGGHGKVAIRAAQLCGIEVVAAFDDASEKHGTTLLGVPVVGNISSILQLESLPTLIAIGDNRTRLRLASQFALDWVSVVHPDATVDCYAEIGVGVLILAGAVIQTHATVCDHAIINDNATVEHDCRIAKGAHASCNSCLAGGAQLGEGSLVGIGASVLPGILVGDGTVVGAGAVVTKNLGKHVTAFGIPAKVLNLK